MPDAYATGLRVLAALEAGRAAHNARVREWREPLVRAVRRELDRDIIEGKSSRGRPKRIACRLHVEVHRVRRILNTLSRVSRSPLSNQINDGHTQDIPE